MSKVQQQRIGRAHEQQAEKKKRPVPKKKYHHQAANRRIINFGNYDTTATIRQKKKRNIELNETKPFRREHSLNQERK